MRSSLVASNRKIGARSSNLRNLVFLFLLAAAFGQGDSGLVTSPGEHVIMRPQSALTPGNVRTTNVKDICNTRTLSLRSVSLKTKKSVFEEYGIHCGDQCGKLYEVDHLISLEIGGTNDLKNLWPQPYAEPGAHQKDVLENKLHALICAGTLTPIQAQKAIASDWWAAYQKYVTPKDRKLGR